MLGSSDCGGDAGAAVADGSAAWRWCGRRFPGARATAVGARDDYEYQPLRIDPWASRSAAASMLAIRAEFKPSWELACPEVPGRHAPGGCAASAPPPCCPT